MNHLKRRVIPLLIIASSVLFNQNISAQLRADFSATPVTGCAPLVVNFTDLSTGNPGSWQWDLGNGTTSTLQHPVGSYFNPGTYSVKLVIQNASGQDSVTKTNYITVYPKPVVAFTYSDSTGCLPKTIQFTDQSTSAAGSLSNWLWDFGDGSTSTVRNPSHTYSTAGNFTVSLRVTNSFGCVTVLTRTSLVDIAQPVQADFTHTTPSVCATNPTVNFTNTSTGQGAMTYQWQFGDGGTSTQQNPSHTYSTQGVFTVTLIAVSPYGCSDTIVKPQLISIGVIQSAFNAPATTCAGSPITLSNTTTPAPLNVQWDFGDGTGSTLVSPVKTYTTPGTYTIKLVNNFGACRDSVTQSITVHPNPLADFTADITSGCQVPLAVTFNTNTPGSSFTWDFGDGTGSTQEDPVHTYTSAGTYTVRLIVTNSSGCSDTLVRTNYIAITLPDATVAGLPRSGCIPLTVSPIPTVTSTEPITGYSWNFGDGGTSTSATPVYTYTTAGTFTVTLTITTASGCTRTITLTDAVRTGTKPVANFTVNPTDVCAETPVNFVNTTPPPTDRWEWDFGDGNTSSLENPSHVYTDTGYFNVQLIVWNNTCPDTIVYNQIVHIRPPIALFSVVDSCQQKFIKRFVDQSIGALTWAWDFGDGQTSSVQHPIHTYAAAGNYTVTLVVTNGPCSYTFTQPVNVVDQQALVVVDRNPICRKDSVSFSAPSVNPSVISAWEWDFGDGSPPASSPSSAVHTYMTAGLFNASLKITDLNGCVDSTPVNIRVWGPTADFVPLTPNICLGNTATFTNLSTTDGTHPLVRWEWEFGDGSTGSYTAPPFQHLYNSRGTYSVSLKITDQYGCTDSIQKPAIVNVSRPVAGFHSPDTITCTSRPISFINESTGTGISSTWHFGDGSTGTQTNPVHSYTSTGIYDIMLIVQDSFGCRDTLTRDDYIHISLPTAGFLLSDTFSTCPPLSVAFTSQAQNNVSVSWDFGNGNTSLLPNPVHNYTIAGVYFPTQYVTGPGGCIDSVTRRIEIRGPSGNFSYSPLQGCAPLTVNFTANALNHTSILWDFTDGATASTMVGTISHTYTAGGQFIPRMILIDSGGCTVPVTGADTIRVTGLNAGFTAHDSIFCDQGLVRFTNTTTSNGSIASWSWDFGDGNSSTAQHPQHIYTTPGFYPVTLQVSTLEGCRDTLTLADTIRIHQRPRIVIQGPASACIPATVQFSSQITGGDSSQVSWNWDMGNGMLYTSSTPAIQHYPNPSHYNIRLIAANEHGCRDTATRIFTANPIPPVYAGSDRVLCTGNSVQLQATGGVSYLWNPSPSLSCTNCSNPVANPVDSSTYIVTGFNQFGCSRADTISVNVRKPFRMTFSRGDTLCIGESARLFAAGADNYSWTPATSLNNSSIANPVATPSTTTTYRVIGRDSDNCFSDTADIPVRVYPYPVVDAGPDIHVSAGSTVRLNPTVSPDVTQYSWKPVYNISCPTCKDPVVSSGNDTEYTLEAKNEGGCATKDVVRIFVTCNSGNLFIPNTFSPNGNGVNEYFYPMGKGIARIKSFRVFNRWGEVVFERSDILPNNPSYGWDGTFRGRKLTTDVFIYTCDVVCENNTVLTYKGDVTLLR